jgi:hypothetical protein
LENRGLNSIDELDPATLPRLAAGDSIRADNFFELLDRLGGAALLMTGGGVERPYLERVALLVDRGTASTAEAVAAALQETGHAVVIGSRTAGTMLAARPIEIATGWTLTLPLVDFRTWGGVRVERVGVEPDIAVSPARKGDPVLQRAVEVLTSGR